jgi:pyruvate dehydrogenase E2 component (dihydrolipoamide acetyltransferase)
MPEITMPRLSDTMEEGTIARWAKQVGDRVERGDVVAEIETDKAVMELESYEAGVLERILVGEGETVPIGQPIALVGTGEGAAEAPAREAADAAPQAPTGQAPGGAGTAEAPARGAAPPERKPLPDAGAATGAATGRVKASPLARAIAREHGLDLAAIRGSGPGGRVVRQDVMAVVRGDAAAAPAGAAPEGAAAAGADGRAPAAPGVRPAPPPQAGPDDEEVPLTSMRRVVARRLVESMQAAPHFYLTVKVDADPLLALRADLNRRLADDGVKLSVNDLLVKACATTLRARPALNVSWGGDKLVRHRRVHVGIAVAVEGGLIVPVIRDADTKAVSHIAREAKELAARARAGRLRPEEFSGGTFTVSNLGMFGISQFTAVINPPEAAILAVGTTEPELALREGEVVSRQVMRLTLSIDHRAVDGATGAEFLQHLKRIVEEPLRVLA